MKVEEPPWQVCTQNMYYRRKNGRGIYAIKLITQAAQISYLCNDLLQAQYTELTRQKFFIHNVFVYLRQFSALLCKI